MARVSYDDFIKAVKKNSPMYGWSVVLAFDLQRTNDLLLRNYVKHPDAHFRVHSVAETDAGTKWHILYQVKFDKPRLSFEAASITDSRASLFMRSVSGKMLEVQQALGGKYKQISRYGIADGLVGPAMTMTINLESAPGGVDSAGKVMLDLASESATDFSFSNVDTEYESGKLGVHLKLQLDNWEAEEKKFELSNLRVNPSDALQPREFELRTRSAPGASTKGAKNYGDGDVLMFVAVNNDARGSLPDNDVPELLPEGSSSNLMLNHNLMLELLLEEVKNVPQFAGRTFTRSEVDGVVSYVIDGGGIDVPTNSFNEGYSQGAVAGHPLQFKTGQSPMRLESKDGVIALRWGGQVEMGAMYINTGVNLGAAGTLRLTWTYEQLFDAVLEERDGQEIVVVRSETPSFHIPTEWIERQGDESAYSALDATVGRLTNETWRGIVLLQENLGNVSSALDAFRLNGLLFPDEAYVKPRQVELPRDLAAVGDLVIPAITITEREVIVAAGGTHEFSLQSGETTGVTWRVDPLPGEKDPGTMPEGKNVYIAPSAASFDYDHKRVLVTASKGDVSDQALVHLVASEVSVYPRVMATAPGMGINIEAASVGGQALTWSLSGNAAGDLGIVDDLNMQDGRKYTPRPAESMPPGKDKIDDFVRVQKITVTNTNQKSAVVDALVLLDATTNTTLKYTQNGSSLAFSFWYGTKSGEVEYGLEEVTFALLSGRGTLVHNIYTPPSDGNEQYIVVAAFAEYRVDSFDWNYRILPFPDLPLDNFKFRGARDTTKENYTKQDIFDRLHSASVLNGWGAALALSCSPLNRILQQQYQESYRDLTFLRPYQGRVDIDEGGSQCIEMDGLLLGPPQISFENADMTNAWATVRMNLIAGDFYHFRRSGIGMQLGRSQSITEGLGFWLEAKVEVTTQMLPAGRRMLARFDLGLAEEFTCNLGATEYARIMIGRELEKWIKNENEIQRVYNVADFDLRNYSPVVPNRLLLRTQRAPWADDMSGTQGEGAVVIFMHLNSDLGSGKLPDRDFPYLIPREATADSALLADSYLDDIGWATPVDCLGSLALPNGWVFNAGESTAPRDVLVLGQIEDGPHTRNISPAVGHVVAGRQTQLKLERGDGPIAWAARNIYRPLVSGSVDAQGLYEARPSQDFVKEVQVNLVTGKYQADDEHQCQTALVVEQVSPVMIAPRLVTWGNGHPDVELVATSVGGATLEWSLVGDQHGALWPQANGRALFSPKETEGGRPEIRLQRIKVSDGTDSAEACVVIVAWPGTLTMEPYHVRRQHAFGPVAFKSPVRTESGETVDAADLTWSVFGEGSIDENGVYTPASEPTGPCSVVMADFMDRESGYAIIEHGVRLGAPSSALNSWYELDRFYLKVMSAPRCYANGLQQIQVRVTLRPQPVDGVYPPINDSELASLRFHFEKGDGVVRELTEEESGIEPSPTDPGTWVMNRNHNPLLEMQPGSGAAHAQEPLEEGEVFLDYWLQTTGTLAETFYAAIQQDGPEGGAPGRWIRSDVVGKENGKITLQGMEPPHSDPKLFDFEASRIEAEGPEYDGDIFTYKFWSIDYWRLSFIKSNRSIFKNKDLVSFIAMDIEPEDTKSLLKWSSTAFEDTFCSYTGFLFGEGTSNKMIFDGTLCRLAGFQGVELDELRPGLGPAPGTLLIALSRVSNFRLRTEETEDPDNLTDVNRATREALSLPFKFRLIDRQGNRHRLQVTFEGDQTARNTLKLMLQPLNP